MWAKGAIFLKKNELLELSDYEGVAGEETT